jgi:two-component system, cell cycle response regulator
MKVLIVEPSKVTRSFIIQELQGVSIEIYEAETAKGCLALCSQIPFEIITLSLYLPDGTGFSVCQTIRNSTVQSELFHVRNSNILFITSEDTIEDRMTGFQSGATDFILKKNIKIEILPLFKEILHLQAFEFADAKILVVDDSEINRLITVQVLKKKIKNIVTAENGKKALDYLFRKDDRLDMIISDLYMPEMDGLELCRRVRLMRNYKTVPFIMLSGASEQKEIVNIFRAGANDYILKPFIKEELLARVKVHLQTWLLSKRI